MRPILAVVLGTVALVVWGMIFWGFLAGPLGMFHTIPEDERVTELLRANGTSTGTYFYPWPRDTPEAFERFVEIHKRGPFYKLSYIEEGVDPQSPGKLAVGCLQYVTVAAMAVALLLLANPGSYLKGLAVVFVAGLMGTNFISIADPIWFHLPWDYTSGALLFETVSWAILGAVVARFGVPSKKSGPLRQQVA